MIEEKKKPQIEILSPAGSYESFLAAIHAGADAVYAGGPRFGARAFADNFTEETLKQAIVMHTSMEEKCILQSIHF